ncbi:MAG: hypothetical protein IPM64_17160 [Phycisphaerales bacterium]|nr:hypothetical protein [Phycisphaerales bacterium]
MWYYASAGQERLLADLNNARTLEESLEAAGYIGDANPRDIYGHSSGTAPAQALAFRYPDRFSDTLLRRSSRVILSHSNLPQTVAEANYFFNTLRANPKVWKFNRDTGEFYDVANGPVGSAYDFKNSADAHVLDVLVISGSHSSDGAGGVSYAQITELSRNGAGTGEGYWAANDFDRIRVVEFDSPSSTNAFTGGAAASFGPTQGDPAGADGRAYYPHFMHAYGFDLAVAFSAAPESDLMARFERLAS